MKDVCEKYSIEIGSIRPPNEGGARSLLIRTTRNCPWNRCAFCSFYLRKKFTVRKVGEVKGDIDTVKIIRNMLADGSVKREEVSYHSLSMVYGWFQSGERTVFLQDSNSLIMPSNQLVKIIDHLMETFPSLERVTSYAKSDTLVGKNLDELKKINEAGLTRLHVGLESGDDGVLKMMKKGVSAREHVEGGRKAKETGFELSEYVMPGLGGKKHWKRHALNTAKVLN
ncbi:MAG: radical SAM protein [Thermoplasmata archaeon]